MIPYAPNPFQVVGPVDEAGFFGREHLTEQLLADIVHNHIYLMGIRRSGKTSLLNHLRRLCRATSSESLLAVFFDLQSVAGKQDQLAAKMGHLFSDAVRAEVKRAKLPPKLANRLTSKLTGDFVSDSGVLDRIAEKNDLRIVLLLDEAEVLLDLDPATLQSLQATWTGALHLRVVLAASKGLAQIGAPEWRGLPLLGNYLTVYLPPMENEEAIALIRRSKPGQTALDVPDAVISAIIELSGNWPSLIQWLCSNLYQPREHTWTLPDPQKSVKLNEGMAACFRNDFGNFSPTERTIVTLLVHGPASAAILTKAVGPSAKTTLDLLQGLGYVRCNGDQFRIGNAFLERWLTENVPIPPVPAPPPRVPPPGAPSSRRTAKTAQSVLELIVELSSDNKALAYKLHSQGGGEYHHQPMGSVPLRRSPETILEHIFARLNTIARRDTTQGTPEEQEHDKGVQRAIGQELYHELFSDELKRKWREIRGRYGDAALQITTNDPWFPWEAVRPYSSAERWYDPPLCETFQLTRWFAGPGAPIDLQLQKASLVHASSSNLRAAQEEIQYILNLGGKVVGFSVDPPLHTVDEVKYALCAGRMQLLHFACHGNFNATDPNNSKLKLGHEYLTPGDLTGECETGLQQAKPLVFVNACHSGAQDFSLAQIGGWAAKFIGAGASAFIGPLWEVNDASAAQFASEFYDRFFGIDGKERMPLATAFREARRALKRMSPADPTWLAYVLYGNPHAEWRIKA